MERRHVLDLWEERFKKIAKVEIQSQMEYKNLMKRYSHILGGTKVRILIHRIMRDEARHTELAKELLEIVKKQKGEAKQ